MQLNFASWLKCFLLLPVLMFSVDVELRSEFKKFVQDFAKVYEDDAAEQKGFEMYVSNLKYIEDQNTKGHSYTLAVNQFTDMHPDDFAKQYLKLNTLEINEMKNSKAFLGEDEEPLDGTMTEVIDWGHLKAVRNIKNQAQCGSCWAFSAVGALESRKEARSGHYVELSEQQLVDCDEQSEGCHGGYMTYAMEYVAARGMCFGRDYPYTAQRHPACLHQNCEKAIKPDEIKGYATPRARMDRSYRQVLKSGPFSVSIDAKARDLMFYHAGIYNGYCGKNLNHGVLLYGVGTEGPNSYWRVKNSWGANWGERGTIRFFRDASLTETSGKCGILLEGVYPVFSTNGNTQSQIESNNYNNNQINTKNTVGVDYSNKNKNYYDDWDQYDEKPDVTSKLTGRIRAGRTDDSYGSPPCETSKVHLELWRTGDDVVDYETCTVACETDDDCPAASDLTMRAESVCVPFKENILSASYCLLKCSETEDCGNDGMKCAKLDAGHGYCGKKLNNHILSANVLRDEASAKLVMA